MKYARTRRLRSISWASLLLFLIGLPVFLTLTRPAAGGEIDLPGVAAVYGRGLSSLGVAGLAATCLALVFGIWLLAGKRRQVGLKYLGANARRRRNLEETARTLAIVFGAAGLIIGSLAGLYAAMIHARPDLYARLPLPFLTAELALTGLFGGSVLYALGRLGR
jgi:hypothetical protein